MKYEDMNSTQKLVSDISGYDGCENGTRNDGYYDEDIDLKMNYLNEYVICSESKMWSANILQAFKFLEEKFTNENDRYHSFKDLI